MSPKPRLRILEPCPDVARMLFARMGALAEEIVRDPGAEDMLAKVEEFAACAYQLRLNVPPPDLEVQDELDARGLLVRPFRDPEAIPEEA